MRRYLYQPHLGVAECLEVFCHLALHCFHIGDDLAAVDIVPL